MNARVLWPIAFVLALGILVFSHGGTPAQPPMEPMGSPMMYGRFVVAHSTADRVLVLDSMTGHVYVHREKDFKKPDELPKLDGGFRPRPMDVGKKTNKKGFDEESKKKDKN